MERLGLLCKSYAGDLAYAERMVASYRRFAAPDLPLFVVVPDADLPAFAHLAGGPVQVMSEQPFVSRFTAEPVLGIRPGYINQEIVKLAFWELGLVENYFCVDSDAEFIRPFSHQDFMHDDSTPYTVLVEDNELKVEPFYYDTYWQSRDAAMRRIQAEVALDDPVVRTCHGHQVFSSRVLRSFKDEFLIPRGWDYLDVLRIAPYEFSWYNMWLQKTRPIEVFAREPFVKVFHHEGQHLEYILRGITVDDIARGYLAIVVNSNYSRDLGVVEAKDSKPESIGRYVSYGELGEVLLAKMKDTYRRRFNR